MERVIREAELANIRIYIEVKNIYLYDFLVEKDILDISLLNILEHMERDGTSNIHDHIENMGGTRPYIINIFEWRSTPQGEDFWVEFSDEYNRRNYNHNESKIDQNRPLEFYYT